MARTAARAARETLEGEVTVLIKGGISAQR